MIELLVGAACYLTLFAATPSMGTNAQVLALLLLFAAAAYAVVLNRVRPVATSATELVLYLIGCAYVVLAMISDDEGIALAIAFLSTIICISVISRAVSMERLLDTGAVVALLCVLSAIAVDRDKAMAALLSSSSAGLLRFMPLGMTPNLVGYVFGGCCMLTVRRAAVTVNRWERVVMAGASFGGFLCVLAASARASLIALAAAAVVAVLFEFRLRRVFGAAWVKAGVLLTVTVITLFPERVFSFFSRMLDLDSSTRGLESGGSGRTGLWARGVATFLEDPGIFAFGGGFRSSGGEQIGFSTESSYISILLDSGLFLGGAVIFVFLCAPLMALRLEASHERNLSPLILTASFFTFVVVESIFNRYLLAIGNPISLMSLLVLFAIAMRRKSPPLMHSEKSGVLGLN